MEAFQTYRQEIGPRYIFNRHLGKLSPFLNVDIAHRHPDRMLLLLLLLLCQTTAPCRTAVASCCPAHSHLLHERDPVGEGDVVEVLLQPPPAAAFAIRRFRRRSVPARRKEGEIAAVAVFSPGRLVVLLLLWLLAIRLLSPLSEAD
jgi:hypothetical protein